MWPAWDRRIHMGFYRGSLKERESFQYLVVEGRIILKQIFNKENGRAWDVLIWLRIETSNVIL